MIANRAIKRYPFLPLTSFEGPVLVRVSERAEVAHTVTSMLTAAEMDGVNYSPELAAEL